MTFERFRKQIKLNKSKIKESGHTAKTQNLFFNNTPLLLQSQIK